MFPLRTGIWTFAILVAAVQGAEPEVISVCEALTHPNLYDHKLVSIRGVQIASMEGGWLKGQNCEGAFITNGYIWPSILWLETSESARAAAGIQGPALESSLKSGNKELKRRGFNNDRDRLMITYVGLFEAYDDSAQEFHPDGHSTRANGFGHLNGAPARIIVSDVKDAVIEKGPSPRPKQKSMNR
jgi:hypothetical protein